MSITEVVTLLVDIGLGALAYSIARNVRKELEITKLRLKKVEEFIWPGLRG